MEWKSPEPKTAFTEFFLKSDLSFPKSEGAESSARSDEVSVRQEEKRTQNSRFFVDQQKKLAEAG